MRIEDAIQQKVFSSEYQKVQINILYTASWLSQLSAQVLKPYNISWQQFNLLRILRGRYPEPATVKILMERMIDKMSNTSRLVEKLRQKGLVERKSSDDDRRQVEVTITPLGLEVLEEASDAMEKQLSTLMDRICEEEASQVNFILDKLRGAELED